MISEFSLFVFTTLAGLAAGSYVVSAFFLKSERDSKRLWLFPLVCLVLLGIGLLGVIGHLGRPERLILAFSNPTAMIAQEGYWSIAFGLLIVFDLIFIKVKGVSSRIVRILAAIAGFVLMVVMGYAYFTSYGNPVWATLPTLLLFVVGDLAMGAGLCALFKKDIYRENVFVIALIVLESLFAVSLVAVAVVFGGYGFSIVPFVIAIFIASGVGILITLMMGKEKVSAVLGSVLVFACTFVGVAIARYAFYAASIM